MVELTTGGELFSEGDLLHEELLLTFGRVGDCLRAGISTETTLPDTSRASGLTLLGVDESEGALESVGDLLLADRLRVLNVLLSLLLLLDCML